ncbi:trp operon leader peptide [Streptomyces sp. NPDC005438]
MYAPSTQLNWWWTAPPAAH